MTFADFGIIITPGATGETTALCPKCSHDRKKFNSPCLSVNVDEGVWNCHHCGWVGSLKGHATSDPFRAPVNPVYKPAPKTFVKPRYEDNGLTEKAAHFFLNRGIPVDVVERNKISSTDDRIFFPYCENGVAVNVQIRKPGKVFCWTTGAEVIPGGMDDIQETTIVCEGFMDKLAMEVAGFTNCISAPSAPPAEAKNYNLNYLDGRDFSKVKKFIMAGDMDAPGRRLMSELSRRFGAYRCWSVEWPEGCKDANDVLLAYGADKIKACLSSATAAPVEGIHAPFDFATKVAELYHNGFVCGLSTGFPSLDPHFTLMGSQWTVLTGTPGSGKSQFIDALILNSVKNHGWKWGVCSMENQPIDFHMMALIEMHNGKNFSAGYTNRLTEQEMEKSIGWLQENISFILPGDKLTVEHVLGLAEVEILRKGIKGLVIDPWNELDHNFSGMSETQYTGKALSQIRRFARKHDTHVVLVAHPTKLMKDKDGNYPVPTPYDISGSAHFYNKADNAITVVRQIGSTMTGVIVQKVRFQKQIGTPGAISLNFEAGKRRYIDRGFDPLADKQSEVKTEGWEHFDG